MAACVWCTERRRAAWGPPGRCSGDHQWLLPAQVPGPGQPLFACLLHPPGHKPYTPFNPCTAVACSQPITSKTFIVSLLVEFIGVMIFTFLGSSVTDKVHGPWVNGLALAIWIYTAANISGELGAAGPAASWRQRPADSVRRNSNAFQTAPSRTHRTTV